MTPETPYLDDPGLLDRAYGGARTGSGHDVVGILRDQLDVDHAAVALIEAGPAPLATQLLHLPAPVDAVLSRLGLALLAPEAVVPALARAVRPGGRVAFLAPSGRTAQHPYYVELLGLLADHLARRGAPPPGLDRRWAIPSLRAGLFPDPDWAVREKDFVLLLDEPPARVVERVAATLPATWAGDRPALLGELAAALPSGPSGRVAFEWPLAVVVAERRGPDQA